MTDRFVPARPTIEELEAKARDCEERATREQEPISSLLKEEARRLREWADRLRSGQWSA